MIKLWCGLCEISQINYYFGEMSEWSMVPDSKSDVRIMYAPRVRIPISPPILRALAIFARAYLLGFYNENKNK